MAKNIKHIQKPPVNDPGRAQQTDPLRKENSAERGNGAGEDPNAQPPQKDRVYGVASRARWPGSDVTEMHKESRQIEGSEAGGEEEEEEEEEETSASDLTVAQLKEALDAAEVEYAKDAKKAELVELYEANNLGAE